MFANLAKFVLQQRLLFVLTALVLLGAGLVAWHRLPIDAFPDVTNVQVMVLTEAPGLAPTEVERQITFPLELEMKGLPHVKQIRSLSKASLSQVVVIFDDDVDIYFARQLVFERLDRAKDMLPPGVEPEMGPISTGLGEIYQYVLKAGYYCPEHTRDWSEQPGPCSQCSRKKIRAQQSLTELRTIQDWVIAPQLRSLRGVNEVNSFGGFRKQYHVIPDPNLLLKYDISLAQVNEALRQNNANVGGNYIIRGGEQLYIVSKGFFTSIEDIQNIVLKTSSGTPIYLRNVAKIQIGGETRQGAVTQDGKGEVVIGMVIMLRGANSKHVVDLVKQEIPKIEKALPPGLKIVPFYDRASLISACVQTVGWALLQGVFLLLLVLFVMLWDMRAAVTVALCLPLTAAMTFMLMQFFGVTANMMSLGGLAIALGVIVDASIVITENIVRHFENKVDSHETRRKMAYAAVLEVARPITFAVLIVVLVMLPLFTLESLEKKMFEPLAITMCFALLSSLVVALTIIPALASLLIRPRQHRNLAETLILKWYLPLLKAALTKRRWAWPILFILITGMLAIVPFLGTEFLPPLDEGAIAVNLVRLPSASLRSSTEQVLAIEAELRRKFPEIETVVSKSGRAEISEDPMGPEQTDLFIMLRPETEWPGNRNRGQLVDAIRTAMLKFPGIKPAFSQPIALRVNELISGVKSDVAVKIFGDDMDRLKKIAEQVAPVLSAVDGATDIKIEPVAGFSQIEVHLKRNEMARHKINAALINMMIETAVGGQVVTHFFEGERRFGVLVRFPLDFRHDMESIRRLLVPSPAGYQIPLSPQLAEIREVETPAQISRDNGQRRLIVECNIRHRDMGSFIAEAQQRLSKIENDLPSGYRLVWGGQFENQQRAMRKLKMVVPLSILIIFMMLYSTFRSFKSALLVLLNLPFAVFGGIMAVFLLNINVSVSAIIGLIALLGIAVQDGTVMVTFFHSLQKQGHSVYDAVIKGAGLRARSIITTSLTTLLGIFPMLYTSGPGAGIQRPVATVVVGGLVSALLLVLIVFPALYLMVNEKKR